jgi:hypothetical protein
MKWHPCCIRIWSSTPKQSSDLANKFVNVWLALVVNRRTKLQITHGSTLETNLEMKDLPPWGRTTTLKTSNIINSLASSAGRGRGARTHLSSWSRRQGGLNRRAHGVVEVLVIVRHWQRQGRGHGHHPPASCTAPPVQSLSHRCPRKRLLQIWRNMSWYRQS